MYSNNFICRKSLLKQIQNFVHLNLATALLMALLIFVGGIERARESEVGSHLYAYSILNLINLICT